MMTAEKLHSHNVQGSRSLSFTDEAIWQILSLDWRRLFPWRERYADQIRRVLADHPCRSANAHVAFGLADPEHASEWLYRDFYVETPPMFPGIERAIGKLRRGNVSEFLRAIDVKGYPEHQFRRMWYEISTLAGCVLGTVVVERDGVAQAGAFEVMPHPRMAPSRILNEANIAIRMREVLEGPIGVEPHRQNLLRTVGELVSGRIHGPLANHSLSLALHHIDQGFKQPLTWNDLGNEQYQSMRRALMALQYQISSPPRFLRLLHEGLRSPWRQRRFLCYRLLRLDGHLAPGTHPDDRAVSI